MELVNENDDFFDPTPRLKSSPIPIMFVPFNICDNNCIYCGEKYTEILFCGRQKYCKKCLLHYITNITDFNIYLDIHLYTRNLDCTECKNSKTDELLNFQEWCE